MPDLKSCPFCGCSMKIHSGFYPNGIAEQAKEYYNVFALPPADVRPVKHGKWIVKTDSEGKTYGVCSCCGYEQYAGHLKYCPECGGKMDGPNQ